MEENKMKRSKSESELHLSSLKAEELLKSPVKPRYADRFLPARAGNSWHMTFPETPTSKETLGDNHHKTPTPSTPNSRGKIDDDSTPTGRETAYSCLLKNEVLGYDYDSPEVLTTPKRRASRKLFHFNSAERPLSNLNTDVFSSYSVSPMSASSQRFVRTPVRKRRRISKHPYKVLDAPELADDYYLNLIDWSDNDIISVALGSTIYSWSAATSGVSRIADYTGTNDHPTSVKWNEKGTLLAVGSNLGIVRIWDAQADKLILQKAVHNHQYRIGVLDWNGDTLFSGSRDRTIRLMDTRSSPRSERIIGGHRQEVCGLKWSSFNSCLASGGNDNVVSIWSVNADKPLHVFQEHKAAVKALSWCPHEKHILTSRGGSNDRCLKFWNTITGSCVASVDTDSQVCNVAWSPHSKELVSTHGYAHNNVSIWKYPALKPVVCLKGHTQRVLYLAMSPDGNCVCTGAPDETLRFWKVFEKCASHVKKSSLDLFDGIR